MSTRLTLQNFSWMHTNVSKHTRKNKQNILNTEKHKKKQTNKQVSTQTNKQTSFNTNITKKQVSTQTWQTYTIEHTQTHRLHS